MIQVNPQSIEEVINLFALEETTLHEEIDWWCYDDKESMAFNIHNHGKDDITSFDVDAYPYAEGQDKPDYSTWHTVKTFNYNQNKKGKR
jgi:hypothetical protein